MRMHFALLLGVFVLSAHTAVGETFPYKTTVISEDVYVRSGPGQNYYPTDKLKQGQEVEVYRHDPGGWCAIRPVEGSFAWVSSRHLKPTEDGLGVVTDTNVAARVGSRFSDVRDVVQVRLHKGEAVEILEAPSRGAAGDNAWYKIAPPAGEFRWVSAKYLSADYPRDGIRRTAPPERERHRRDLLPDDEERAPREASAPLIPAAALPGGGPVAEDEPSRRRPSRPRSLSPEEYQAELDRIELELSMMVIEDSSLWSLEPLTERANHLLDESQTAVERGRARLLANKISRFDDIKERQQAVREMRYDTDWNTRMMAKLRPQDTDRKKVAQTDGRYDGVGRLTQVVSPKTGAPRYALVDRDSGDVQCYVTPAPGVQLQNYVGREVGVNGSRGYIPEQRASHIMARHVSPLEGSTLR